MFKWKKKTEKQESIQHKKGIKSNNMTEYTIIHKPQSNMKTSSKKMYNARK